MKQGKCAKAVYAYHSADKLSKRTDNALIQTFNANNLNQLTTGTRSGTLTAAGTTTEAATSVIVNSSSATRYTDDTFAREGLSLVDGNNTITAVASDSLGRGDTNSITVKLPATVTFNYDLKGNLTNDARRIFTYDDENQLVSVVVTNSTTDSTRSEFLYDGLFRRRVRKEFKWQGGTFIPTEEVRYVYDGRLPIQERNGYNVPMVTYTRSNDLSGSREGAGGIGGLLARTDQTQITPAHAYYHADGNGNVTALIDAQQRIAARYIYDPYGNILAMSGPLAEANLYRFSSKEAHPASGLVYYLYRYYDPNLQRWVNQDPIGEAGGLNLYGFAHNGGVNRVDPFGDSDNNRPPILVDCHPGTANCRTVYGPPKPEPMSRPGGGCLTAGGLLEAASVMGMILEPLDWIATCGEICKDPKNPLSYAGLLPFIPSASGRLCKRAVKPKWPETAQEMDDFLKVPGQKVPDGPTTPGRDKTVWRPNEDTKITLEQHPYDVTAPDWHRGPHWHLDTPGKLHERFLPGDDIPGY